VTQTRKPGTLEERIMDTTPAVEIRESERGCGSAAPTRSMKTELNSPQHPRRTSADETSRTLLSRLHD
jgi:hypothetical protein